jgi:hypothetical protein
MDGRGKNNNSPVSRVIKIGAPPALFRTTARKTSQARETLTTSTRSGKA